MNMAKSTLCGLRFVYDLHQYCDHNHRNSQAVACKVLKINAEHSASSSVLQVPTHSASSHRKIFRKSKDSLERSNGQVHGIRGTVEEGTEETHRIAIPAEEMATQEAKKMDYLFADKFEKLCTGTRREAILKPLLTMCFCTVHSIARAENNGEVVSAVKKPEPGEPDKKLGSLEKKTNSRIYDATVIGEPVAFGKDTTRAWNKLLGARVVYLGEAEFVPDPDDKLIELEIVQNLRDKCLEQERPISLALQAFPCNLQPQLNQYMSKRINDEDLKSFVSHWPVQRWEEYKPLLHYSCNNGIRLIACGTPLEILRTVQAEGVQGLTGVERRKYVPPAGAGFISNSSSISRSPYLNDVFPLASLSFGPGSYLFAQARVVEDYVMSQIVTQAMEDGGSVGLLVVVTGASHVVLGSKGVGLPARISKKMPKKTQVVVLLNPERQHIRREGQVPVADFLWYSAAKPCTRNCFDRAEIARIMDAASRRRDALPQDLQRGLDLGLVSPEVLQNFFDLEKQPFIAELIHHFQGFRERWLADPRFLQRLAIEESISITTALIAQYERRKEHFIEELHYVITDTVRGAVVDFFTVWLPAPTLSFLSYEEQSNASGTLEFLQGLLGSLPDNAFQRNGPGQNWSLQARTTAVLIGGIKLFCVGFISSLGTVSITKILFGLRQWWSPGVARQKPQNRSPVLKTALVYGSFLGTSANLRYQAIAGIVEHWIADYLFASQPVQGNVISFLARTLNSYWGTQAISVVRCRDSDGILMHELRRQLDLPENREERAIVESCGLYRAMETVRPPMDMSLLLELCRLWSPQRGGFVFPWGGIYRVTAEDIRRILGVASRGDVCVLTSRSLGEEREAARVLYGGDEPGPHGVPLASIVGGRARLAIQAILTTLVQRVTGSTNYSSVPTGWRRTLEACLGGRRMDWATVIRGSLAAKLGRVTQKSGPGAGILELPYCSILISWLHEYFPATGPAREAVVDEEMPRMQRWTGVPRGEQARMVARPVWGRRVTALTVADYVADPFGDCAWASDAEEEGRPAGGVAEHAVPIADIPPEVPVAGDEEGSAAGGAPEVAAGDPEAMEDPVGRPTESVEILPEGDMPGREGRRVAAWLKVFFPNIGRHPMLREVELEGLGGPWERAIQARHVISQYDAQSSTMAEWAARMEAMDAQFAGQNSVIDTLRETISGLQASLKTQQDLSVAQQSTIATLIGQPRRRVRPRVDGGAGTSQEETSGGGTEPAPPT